MGTTVVRRPPRVPVPEVATAPVVIAAPPATPDGPTGTMNPAMLLMPVMSGSGGLMMTLTNGSRPVVAAVGLVMLVVSVAMAAAMWLSTRLGPKRRLRDRRERYLDYLDELRSFLRGHAAEQRAAAEQRHPRPAVLATLAADDARRWERRAEDPDLWDVRCGTARLPLSRPLSMDTGKGDPLTGYDPVCQSGAEALVDRYTTLPGLPLTVPLARTGRLDVLGDGGPELVRAMLSQLITLVGPEDLGVAVVHEPRHATRWSWLHHAPQLLTDIEADTPVAMLSDSGAELSRLLESELETRRADRRRRRGTAPGPGVRHLVVVVDATGPAAAGDWDVETDPSELALHVIRLVDRPTVNTTTITVDGDRLELRDADPATPPITGEADRIDADTAAGIARVIAGVRFADPEAGQALHGVHDLPEFLGVSDVAKLDPARAWRVPTDADELRVPIGVAADGTTVELDLKESAEGGMGPHGLVVGATGSGKSETLRTLVAALTARHGPDRLALLTVDYKGGATFADFEPLPHNAGSVTNLASDPTLIDRFREALYGEMTRRQQLLKDTGNLPGLTAYRRLRDTERPELPPLPRLLVIIDEFAELLTARPELSELFTAVGRIGRSIGIHLLLATQRLETGHIRGLESHLSYRIGLRTFSEAESREAIGTPDAYRLPPEPGSAYLTVDTTVYTRFKAAMVSVPHRTATEDSTLPVLGWPTASADPVARALESLDRDGSGPRARRTVLQVLVDRLTGVGAAPVRPVWLPALPAVLPLDTVPEAVTPADDVPGQVTAVLGRRDRPRRQDQPPAEWDLTGSQANLLVLGAPVSGKSTLLRTLVSTLALRYPPGRIACYCVDYGGGALAPLERLPHVAVVAGRSGTDLVRRTVSDVRSLLDERETLLRHRGLDSIAALRRAHAAGDLPPGTPADILLIIDGWGALRDAELDLDEAVLDIAARGPALGVHTVLTATGPSQLRSRLTGCFGGRVELRLTDAFDSAVDRKAAAALPKDVPGRALLTDGDYAQLALPALTGSTKVRSAKASGPESPAEAAGSDPTMGTRHPGPDTEGGLDSSTESGGRPRPGSESGPAAGTGSGPNTPPGSGVDPGPGAHSREGDAGPSARTAQHDDPADTVHIDPAAGLAAVIDAAIRRWDAPPVRRVRLLPDRVTLAEIGPDPDDRLVLGLSEHDLGPATVDLSVDPHLVLFGDPRTGKSTALRTVLRQLIRRPASDVGIALVDHRRSHLDTVPTGHLLSHCTSPTHTAQLARELATSLAERQPGPEVTAAQLRDRSWWTGLEVFIVVDDYELVATGQGNPLAPLLPLVSQAADLGFHLIVARRTGGASRALFEPVLQAVTDTAGPGLLFSGDRMEGRLLNGVAPRRLPPGRALLSTRDTPPTPIQVATE